MLEEVEWNSHPVRIRGFDWNLCTATVDDTYNGLEFFIKCNGGSRGPKWNCVATVILHGKSDSEKVEMGRNDDIQFDKTSTGDAWIRICEVIVTIRNDGVTLFKRMALGAAKEALSRAVLEAIDGTFAGGLPGMGFGALILGLTEQQPH